MYLGSSSSSSGSSLHSRRSFLVCFLHDRQFRMWIRCRKAGVRRLSGPVQHQGPLPDPSVLRCLSIEAHLTNEILIDYDISNASNFLREREKKKRERKETTRFLFRYLQQPIPLRILSPSMSGHERPFCKTVSVVVVVYSPAQNHRSEK